MSRASDILQKITIGGRKLASDIDQGVGSASEFVRKNPVTSSVAVSGGVLAGVTAVQIVRKKRKASAKPKKRKPSTRKAKPKSRRKVSKKKPAKKRVSKSKSKKIRLTKKGQPYIILPNGRAKFIKKSSASRMRKTKGGYY